ncbi:hypothetical protein [Actinomadura madurae]|uniref:hypothetical protein n=1 Tax=Actinomadura madurae TaxID=1993 RepID=UPI0020D1F583|nr:hypothetical protein [Actinomadura madurae]MCP9947605.1 hypothetical protein [Actinomadura madurae]MCP9976853.1 hypothetical protein [Actinomadura madurae]MCQ0011655.1 hypothetical protein [Actinomadura madurae]
MTPTDPATESAADADGPALGRAPAISGSATPPTEAEQLGESSVRAAYQGTSTVLSGVPVRAPRPAAVPAPETDADLDATGQAGDEAAHWNQLDRTLSAGATERIERSLAAGTRAVYAREWAAFARWCWLTGRTTLPASAQTLASYLDHLTRTPTSRGTPPAPGTLNKVLGALQGVHKAAGHSVDVRLARSVLKDYARERSATGHRPRRSAPITAQRVLPLLVHATLDAVTTPRLADRISALRAQQTIVSLVLGLVLGGRASEMAALDIADVTFTADWMSVTIRASKTDQNAGGSVQHVQRGKHVETCPVRLTQAWIDTLAAQGVTTGPLIRAVDQYDRLSGTPGYAARANADGRVGKNYLTDLVRDAVARANADAVARGRKPPLGDPRTYSAHGLRAGLATSAGEANIPPTTIADRGRWKTLLMVMQYWRDGAALARQLEAEIGL